ncbi:MAG: aldehyde dehydrogenase family protein [Myxococcales bacterium]|nr:aldehyde dehydrogenase family protein [Myxococcales bacterium]
MTTSAAIGSEPTKSNSPVRMIPCFDPATRTKLGEVPVVSPAELRERVARARAAQQAWRETSFAERRRVLGYILDHLLEHADELAATVVRDAGKTRENAMVGEVWPVCEKIRNTIARGEEHLRAEKMSAGLFLHKKAEVHYQPLGVIGVIAPWNYPLQNILGPTIPALFAGNAVLIKPSEHVAWSSARFQRIFDDALDRAGMPRELVQVVDGYAETGAALVAAADKIIFTGSMANGRRIIETSAATLTPVILELGGKDAFIVCDDADIERAAHAAMAGIFIAAGQNCLAAERFIVMDGAYDAFVSRVVELTKELRQGPPLGDKRVDVGAMTTPMQLEIVEKLVADAVAKGARVLAGGHRNHPELGDFFAPTILADVPKDAAILEEETFGPVMVIIRAQGEDDAVRIANSTQYGLSATVMTKSASRARRLVDRIVAGGTSVNDFGFTYMAMDLPFGGVRGSGFGRLNGREGIRACTNPKAVLYDRFPFGAPAKIYPVGTFDYDIARETIRTIYSRGVVNRVGALGRLAKAALFAVRGGD